MKRIPWVALAVALVLSGCARPADDPWLPTAPQALLWEMFFASIIVEVDHTPGHEIPRAALDAAIDELRGLTGRPIALGTVRELPGYAADPDRERTDEEALQLARAALDDPSSDARFGANGSAVLHVVSLDGHVRESHHPLGFTAHNTAFVFEDEIAALQPAGVQHPNYGLDVQQTLTHEMGHAVGLVDCHVPMVRPHSNDDCHSVKRASVMFVPHSRWDSTFELARPGTQRLHFDEYDRADISAYIEQGKRCQADPVGCNEPWRGASRATPPP